MRQSKSRSDGLPSAPAIKMAESVHALESAASLKTRATIDKEERDLINQTTGPVLSQSWSLLNCVQVLS